MLIFISGGVRSGKSTLGEKLAHEIAENRKVYLATSVAYDDEMIKRIEMHKEQRKDKGFYTVEKSSSVGEITNRLNEDDTVLMDCLGNLLANEMFGNDTVYDRQMLSDSIFKDILSINERTGNLIIISNDVFSDGCRYSDSVMEYIDILAELHKKIVDISDKAIECVSGNAVIHRDCS